MRRRGSGRQSRWVMLLALPLPQAGLWVVVGTRMQGMVRERPGLGVGVVERTQDCGLAMVRRKALGSWWRVGGRFDTCRGL